MASLPFCTDNLPADVTTYSIGDAADRLGVSETRVRTLIRDNALLVVRRDGEAAIPAQFFDDEHGIAKHFSGLVSVLVDGGYTLDEVMSWLFTEIEDLGMRPADALHTHSAREVIRRAQAQAF